MSSNGPDGPNGDDRDPIVLDDELDDENLDLESQQQFLDSNHVCCHYP